MISFSLPILLFYILITMVIPGTILVFGLIRNKNISFIEKLFLGASFSPIIYAILPFFEFLFLGIKFNYTLAIINTLIYYVLAFGIFYFMKMKNNEKIFDFEKIKDVQKNLKNINIDNIDPFPFVLFILFILAFWVRVQTLSPIYSELDPYYYMYITQQIITFGFNPLDDKTAWYPELKVNHRQVPLLAYMEANWYSFYSPNDYSNYILSYVANVYPPLMAAFTLFLMYFFLRQWYDKWISLASAALFSSIPMYLLKTFAGEAEAQPYAFFAISLFLVFFSLSYKYRKNIVFPILAGFSYWAISLGSSSEIVGAVTLSVSLILISLFDFIYNRKFNKNLYIIAGFGILSGIIKSLYINALSINYSLGILFALIFVLIIDFLKNNKQIYKNYSIYSVIAAFVGFSLFLYITPLWNIIKKIILAGLSVGEYYNVLAKTIAEQGTAGASLSYLGVLGMNISLLKPFSMIFDFLFGILFFALNNLFNLRLIYIPKEGSLVFLILFASIFAIYYSAKRLKDNNSIILLLIAFVVPPILIGLLKTKFGIYLGYSISLLFGFILGELYFFIKKINLDNKFKNVLALAVLFLAFLVPTLEAANSYIPPLLKAGFVERFQDNPYNPIYKDKFSSMCAQLNMSQDPSANIVCEAAKDPVGFANKSIDNQYNYLLCVLSQRESITDNSIYPGDVLRCSRISDYWLNSMLWIKNYTEQNARITSWWDYGHWENFFGQRNAVIRNEHKSLDMILTIAYDYTEGTPLELKEDMLKYDSEYALFDKEILFGGNSFGGKYGALNYLGCAKANGTNISLDPGKSYCEYEHQWEQVLIPKTITPSQVCDISYDKKGVIVKAILARKNGLKAEYYTKDEYCLGNTTVVVDLFSNKTKTIPALYELNNRDKNGNLKLHKAILQEAGAYSSNYYLYNLIYIKAPIWIVNGSLESGWEDRRSKFYDSNIYQAFILNELDGFNLVYNNGDVKIYKIKK